MYLSCFVLAVWPYFHPWFWWINWSSTWSWLCLYNRYRDHTASYPGEKPRSRGPHSQLCWGPAWELKTTQYGTQGLESINIKNALLKKEPIQVKICYLPTELFGRGDLYEWPCQPIYLPLVICPLHFQIDEHFITNLFPTELIESCQLIMFWSVIKESLLFDAHPLCQCGELESQMCCSTHNYIHIVVVWTSK